MITLTATIKRFNFDFTITAEQLRIAKTIYDMLHGYDLLPNSNHNGVEPGDTIRPVTSKIVAIKMIRRFADLGMKEAKYLWEELEDEA